MNKKRILLIDDDPLFLMLTCKLLEKESYLEGVETFTTPEEAHAYFEKLRSSNSPFPDAVFIDIDMPMLSGLELAQQLYNEFLVQKPGTPIYILSSSFSQRDRQTAEKLEAVHDYMEKPLSPELLREALSLPEVGQQPGKPNRSPNKSNQNEK